MRTPLLCALAILCGGEAAHAQGWPANVPGGYYQGYGSGYPTAAQGYGYYGYSPYGRPMGYGPYYQGNAYYPGNGYSPYYAGQQQYYPVTTPQSVSVPMEQSTPASVSAAAAPAPEGSAKEPEPLKAPTPAGPATSTATPTPAPASVEVVGDVVDGGADLLGHQRCWVGADYTLTWIRQQRFPALVTTGSTNDAHPGALDQSGTAVLLGGGFDFGESSGLKLALGAYLDPDFHFSLELDGSYMTAVHAGFSLASDSNGNPLISRPVFNVNDNREAAFLDSFPGKDAGSINVDSWAELYGTELNFRYHSCLNDKLTLGGLFGARFLRLGESLTINDRVNPFVDNSIRFEGMFVNPPNSLTDFDRFKTTNNYYGLQLGGDVRWDDDKYFVSAFAKLALGATDENVNISGQSTLITPLSFQNAPGGILALPSNIGSYERATFSLVPELGFNVGVKVTPHINLTAGYSFLAWTQVVRPGDQIDRNINPTQVPTDNSFGQSSGPIRPLFHFNTETFWANTLSVGVDCHY
jgi:hypothetical protein